MATKKRNQTVDYLVYLVVRSLVALLQAMPPALAIAFSRALARLAFTVDKRHRNVAKQNLALAFGDQYSSAQRERMVLGVYEHFLEMVIEMAQLPRRMRVTNWKHLARLENGGALLRSILDGKPTLIVTGHFGNWELAGYLLGAIGLRSHAIARDLDNRYLHDFLLKFRERTGQTILSKSGDFDRINQVLADRGVLISLGDQSAGPKGLFVDFFGRPASTHKAIALLALEHQATIFVGYAYRVGDGLDYCIRISDPIRPTDFGDSPDAAAQMTRAFTHELESAIRLAPEQYLWLHNRWKHQPAARKRAAKKAA